MDGLLSGGARIGPNAILQLVPVLDRTVGLQSRLALFDAAAVALPPQTAGMLPQAQVIRLHRHVVQTFPDRAPFLLREAGLATGDYILANRIPALAQRLIRLLPRPLAARVLAAAIAKHAWTFAGSGQFRIEGYRPLTLTITHNPLATSQVCDWHAAVFERLFSRLVWPKVRVVETDCCGAGSDRCRFQIFPE